MTGVQTCALPILHDYGDPRLLKERGFVASLSAAWVDAPVAVAGVEHKQATTLCAAEPVRLPTLGASSGLFALAAMVDSGSTGSLVGVEQASLSGVRVADGTAEVHRREPAPRPKVEGQFVPGADIPISLAAYERAFDAKVRWEAGKYEDSDDLDFPPRYRVDNDGTLQTDYTFVPLPRTGSVYTEVTVHVPVPGLKTPYSLVIVELDDVDVRALVKVTGVEPGTVEIGRAHV